jgi:hypothetical protein
MHNLISILTSIALSVGLTMSVPVAAGPTSILYLTAFQNTGPNADLVALQGDTVLWDVPGASSTYEFPIAVASTIRTLGHRSGNVGSEYNLDGLKFTGTHYTFPHVIHDDLADGTTNGESNFAVSFYEGAVYQFSNSWTHPQLLYSLDSFGTGITYDRTTNSLWTSSRANIIENRALDGSLLGSFFVDIPSDGHVTSGLAMDPADHTLWLTVGGIWDEPLLLQQYSTTGILLSEQYLPQLNGRTSQGSEFKLGEFTIPPVPEPETYLLMLAGLGMLLLVIRRGKRRSGVF